MRPPSHGLRGSPVMYAAALTAANCTEVPTLVQHKRSGTFGWLGWLAGWLVGGFNGLIGWATMQHCYVCVCCSDE
jgi:hypothetical protein